MEYLDDIWLRNTPNATIEKHKAFFEVFSRDDGKFKRDLIRLNPALITFLAEFHSITLIKLDQAKQALEAVNLSTTRFLGWPSRIRIAAVADLQRDLGTFFVGLAGALDAADAEIEIVTNPAHFKVEDGKYANIKDIHSKSFAPQLPADLALWLERNTLNKFRNFLVHRFSLSVLALTSGGTVSFRSHIDSNKTVTFEVFVEPAHVRVNWDPKLLNIVIQRLRETDRLPLWEFNPEKIYVNWIHPIMPIVLLPSESELRKSPEEIEEFQEEDVRDFCKMNYEMTLKLLGLVYAFLIRKWSVKAFLLEPEWNQIASSNPIREAGKRVEGLGQDPLRTAWFMSLAGTKLETTKKVPPFNAECLPELDSEISERVHAQWHPPWQPLTDFASVCPHGIPTEYCLACEHHKKIMDARQKHPPPNELS